MGEEMLVTTLERSRHPQLPESVGYVERGAQPVHLPAKQPGYGKEPRVLGTLLYYRGMFRDICYRCSVIFALVVFSPSLMMVEMKIC